MSIRLSLARDLKIHSVGTVSSSSFRMAAYAEDNVVVIGGPAMNEVWETYANRLDAPYEFRIIDDRYRIVAREGDASFGETRSVEGKEDHALVVFACNPCEPRSRVVMMAGCGYLATLAAPWSSPPSSPGNSIDASTPPSRWHWCSQWKTCVATCPSPRSLRGLSSSSRPKAESDSSGRVWE